jgi:hypothetical protein
MLIIKKAIQFLVFENHFSQAKIRFFPHTKTHTHVSKNKENLKKKERRKERKSLTWTNLTKLQAQVY